MNLRGIATALLRPLSVFYGLGTRLRAWFYARGLFAQKRLKGKVISVGNLTLGGTGKTPMVLWLAQQFLSGGKSVGILSRGYGGTGESSDEIELMKQRLKGRLRFGVGPDRYASGQKLEASQPVDVFILDDGFQHLRLARDANILLVDSSRPLDQEALLPAGRLREPLSAMRRADLLVFTRSADPSCPPPVAGESARCERFSAATHLVRYREIGVDPQAIVPEVELPPQPVFIFCGIGNPEAFVSDAARWGNAIAGKAVFRDHHRYSASEVRRLEEQAKRAGARSLLTTEKDLFNLGDLRFSSLPIYFPEIELKVADAPEFLAALERKLATAQKAPA
jgi:tetraacyldisaccharide 4'-kinase